MLGNRAPSKPDREHLLWLAVLAVAVVVAVAAVHQTVLTAPVLSFDDSLYLKENDIIPNPGWASVGRVFTEVWSPTVPGYYEPLSMLSLMADYAMGGRADDLRPFHRTSMVLHLLVTAQIVLLMYLLFRNPWAAAMTGLLFGLHPMTIEPIALISQRKTLLAAFFAWGCLISYVLYARHGGRKAYLVSLAAFVLAGLSKPTSVPLPVLLVVLDYWPLRRLNGRALWEKVPFLAIAVLLGVITIVSTQRTGGIQLPGEQSHSLAAVILKICYLNLFYLCKVVWPTNLCLVYPLPEPLALSGPLIRYACIATLLFLAGMLLSLRRTRGLLSGWLLFFIALFPSLGIVGYTWVPAADKYVYLPAIGLLLLVTWLLDSAWRRAAGRSGRLLRVVLFLAVISLAIGEARATMHHLYLWQDDIRFNRRMVELAPNSGFLRNDLGLALASAGQPDEAIEQYLESLRIGPPSPEAHCNLAIVLTKEGNHKDAICHYKKALELKTTYAAAQIGLGNILAHEGKNAEAIAQYEAVLRRNPAYADGHYDLGVVLSRLGRFEEAAAHFETARRQLPRSAAVYYGLASAMAGQGRLDAAASLCQEAIRLRPGAAEYHVSLGNILDRQQKTSEAIEQYRKALQIKPDHANAHNSLGGAFLRQGKVDQAMEHLTEALRLCPDHPQARMNLDFAKRQRTQSLPAEKNAGQH